METGRKKLLVKSKLQQGKHAELETSLIIWMTKLNAKASH